MESKKIYESSKDELNKIKKQLGTDSINIDITKLDSVTKEALITAIKNAIAERYPRVEQMTLGVE